MLLSHLSAGTHFVLGFTLWGRFCVQILAYPLIRVPCIFLKNMASLKCRRSVLNNMVITWVSIERQIMSPYWQALKTQALLPILEFH